MDISEYHLILLLKNNDKEAYKFIFRSYYLELYYLALKYIPIQDDAKDLTQSTFIKLWENRSKLLDDKPLKPFLFTIHKHNCLDFLKNKINQKTKVSVDFLSELESSTPLETIALKELEYRIMEAIASLPPKCRQIFEYSRFKELKYTEIAHKLNISVKTVENQMSIALDKLRTKLIDYLPLLIILFSKF
jgi:RNA polymerase sigma-70 factor, ECF subfamily